MQATLLFTLLALGAPAPKEKPNPAADLAGLWELERVESNDKQPEVKRKGPVRFRFTKEGTYIVLEGEKEIVGARELKFDPKASPATLDFRIAKEEDLFVLGIYKIEEGKLTICKAMPGNARPTKFEVPERSPNYLMFFRRVKE